MGYVFDSNALIDFKYRFPKNSTIPFFQELWKKLDFFELDKLNINELKKEFKKNPDLRDFLMS